MRRNSAWWRNWTWCGMLLVAGGGALLVQAADHIVQPAPEIRVEGSSRTEPLLPREADSPSDALPRVMPDAALESPYLPQGTKSSTVGECEPLCCCWEPTNYFQIDALFLGRSNQALDQPVVLNNATGDTVLSVGDLDFSHDVGPRVLVGRRFAPCTSWELGYFGVNAAGARAEATDFNNLDIPGPLVAVANDFDAADEMLLTYRWRVNNAEFNLVREANGVEFLAGFRYFNLHETFNIRSFDSDGDVSDYNVRSSNHLFGGQIGARYQRQSELWRFGFTGKAGVFGNDASQHQLLFDNDNTILLRDAGGREGGVSFVGDLDLFVSRQLTEVWSVRAGYYLLWVTDVALAPDQLDFEFDVDSGTDVRSNGNAFFHGATLGLEARW